MNITFCCLRQWEVLFYSFSIYCIKGIDKCAYIWYNIRIDKMILIKSGGGNGSDEAAATFGNEKGANSRAVKKRRKMRE